MLVVRQPTTLRGPLEEGPHCGDTPSARCRTHMVERSTGSRGRCYMHILARICSVVLAETRKRGCNSHLFKQMVATVWPLRKERDGRCATILTSQMPFLFSPICTLNCQTLLTTRIKLQITCLSSRGVFVAAQISFR